MNILDIEANICLTLEHSICVSCRVSNARNGLKSPLRLTFVVAHVRRGGYEAEMEMHVNVRTFMLIWRFHHLYGFMNDMSIQQWGKIEAQLGKWVGAFHCLWRES